MSHPVRLFLRAPPHVPFVQGYPGIPATPQTSTRKPPAICGTVEVRPGGATIKAKWVRVELRRHEALPAALGFPNPSKGDTSDNWVHVGGIQTLWQAPAGKEYGEIGTVDHQFFIPLPDDMPPSVDILRGGIRYELVAAVCYKKKGGVFKGDSPEIIKVSEEIRIIKHDLHSVWPLYNVPDERVFQDPARGMIMTAARPYTAFGPTDRVVIIVTVRSSAPHPVKIKHFEAQLQEMITALPRPPSGKDSKSKKAKAIPQPITRVRGLTTMKCPIEQMVGRGGEKTGRLELVSPDMLGSSFRGGKLMEVSYEVEVKAVFEGQPEMRSKGIRYVAGAYPRAQAQEMVGDIGFFEPLCPPVPGVPVPPMKASAPSMLSSRPSSTHSSIFPGQMQAFTPPPQTGPGGPGHSPAAFPGHMRHVSLGAPGPGMAGMGGSPQQFLRAPVQGFPTPDSRRLSSTTISTTTTGTNLTADFVAPLPNNRAATAPNRASLAFPSPHPAGGGVARNPSVTYSIASSSVHGGPNTTPPPGPSRAYQSELGHGDRRVSSMTAATFGNWDPGLQNAMRPSEPPNMSPIPARSAPGSPSRGNVPLGGACSSATRPADPSTWLTSEQEKLRLYNAARQKAAINQQGAGASLNRIGMEDAGVSLMGGPIGSEVEATNGDDGAEEPPPPEYAPPRPNKPHSSYSPVANSSAGLESPTTRAPASSAVPLTPATPLKASSSATPAAASLSASAGGAGPSAQAKVPAPLASISDEKAQMKAYYEAKDRVERMRLGESSAGADSATSAGSSTRDTLGPADTPLSSANTASAGGSSSNPGPSKVTSVPAAPYMSAAEEKEAMKRRYEEAMAKVARTQGVDSPVQAASSSSASAIPSPIAAASPIIAGPSSSASMPTQYLSAEQEKEIMRRRFEEASARVAKTQGLDNAPVPSSSSRTPLSPTVAPPQPGTYLSAEQEKDLMRKRYEDATAKVTQRRASPPPIPARAEAQLSTAPASQASRALALETEAASSSFMAAEEEEDLMRKRYEEATIRLRTTSGRSGPLPSTGIVSPDFGAGSSWPAAQQAAPPPLPDRPAALADYATLLAPAPSQPRP